MRAGSHPIKKISRLGCYCKYSEAWLSIPEPLVKEKIQYVYGLFQLKQIGNHPAPDSCSPKWVRRARITEGNP